MLSEREWQLYEQILYRMREFRREGEMLLFTSRSLVDLQLMLSRQLLSTDNEAEVLRRWEANIEPFLVQLHTIAEQHNPTVELRGQTFRIVSERVAGEISDWMEANCPRGLD